MSRNFAGLDSFDAKQLLSLTRLPQWEAMMKYLSYQEKTAVGLCMKLNNSPEKSGYYKGIYGLAKDVKGLSSDLQRFLDGYVHADEGFVSLDSADAL